MYHYTDTTAASNIIDRKEIYLTRADHFLDNREIKYGMSILENEAKRSLSEDEFNEFKRILNILSERFKTCFVFCFSQNNNSEKHKEIHGGKILQFEEYFPSELACMSYHAIPEGDGFRLYYTTDIYKLIEGFVIYEQHKQFEIAIDICKTFDENRDIELHIVDQFHFVDVLMKFILLCKEPCFAWEEEYRIALLTNEKWDTQFENIKKNNKIYIKLITPTEIREINNNA